MRAAKRGHVKIARKTFEDDKWWKRKRVFSKWEAWVDMIQLAQWEPKEFCSTKFGSIKLERGEFVLSLRLMAKRWGWSFQSVRSFTQSPEFGTRLAAQRSTQAGTVYLIVNYDLYQSTDEQVTHPTTQQTTHLQHTSNTRTSSKALTTTTPVAIAPVYAFMGEMRPVWRDAYGGPIPPGAAKRLKPLVDQFGAAEVASRLGHYLAETDAQFASIPRFVSTFGTWTENGHPRKNGAATQEEQHRKRGLI